MEQEGFDKKLRKPFEAEENEVLQGVEKRLDADLTTREALDAAIVAAFDEVCGEYGKETFFSVTVPAVWRVYGHKVRKAGLRFLDIIKQGSELPQSKIDAYFASVVTDAELEYAGRSQEERFEAVATSINETILQVAKQTGQQDGIIGAILHGSFASRETQPNSDIDIVIVLGTSEEGAYDDTKQQYVGYLETFVRLLGMKTRRIVDAMDVHNGEGVKGIFGDGDEFFFPSDDQHVVVSLYPDKRREIEKILGL